MCTFSFVPTSNGYYAAMNRDERLTRETALPPRRLRAGDLLAAYPQEPSGGSWIASNECSITLALLNWNLSQVHTEQHRSRGCVIPQLIGQGNLVAVTRKLNSLPLDGILPFRLLGIFSREQELYEWRWDGAHLTRLSLPWHSGHWFSSGLSDELAAENRGGVCQLAWQEPTAGTLPWLQRLHRSHSPVPGPFSICVHRPDAATVSYSEIVHDSSKLTFKYAAGHPCQGHPILVLDIPLLRNHSFVA